MKKIYECSKCYELFTESFLGHCPICDHHYKAGTECKNCHESIIQNTMNITKIENLLNTKGEINGK